MKRIAGLLLGVRRRATRRGRLSLQAIVVCRACSAAWYRRVLDRETGGASSARQSSGKRGERSDIARTVRARAREASRAAERSRAGPARRRRTRCDRAIGCTDFDCGGSTLARSICAEEVHGQMERFGTRPANVRDALAKLALQTLRHREPRIGERHGEEAPHPCGFGGRLALGLGLAGGGSGSARARIAARVGQRDFDLVHLSRAW